MKRAIEKFTVEYGEDRPIVMALIDGVGFKFAKSSLRGVLDASDEFCQFNTLWKAIVVASYLMSDDGLKIFLTDEDFEKYDTFLNEYGYDEAKRLHSSPKKGVKIGNAIFERVKPGPYDVKKEYLQSTICE